MFFNSLTLILQEMLEASLLISVLLALPQQIKNQKLWVLSGVFLGAVGALINGENIETISQWFNYVGQEVLYATIQIIMTLLLFVIVYSINRNNLSPYQTSRLVIINAVLIALAITREGAEIFIYLSGVISDPYHIKAALAGGFIGTGIAVSIGILTYYLISSLPSSRLKIVGTVLLALIGGNLTSQAILLLTQADWLMYTPQLWDSSAILPEHSLLGRLLYSLIGYEATPSAFQVSGYITTMLLIYFCAYLARHFQDKLKHEQI